MSTQHTPAPWQEGRCQVPMWSGGTPSGSCGQRAYGHQLPERLFAAKRPYCYGHCCPMHGGPAAGEPIVFQDGTTPEGRPMWCAVMPDFIDLQVSEAAFSGDPVAAVAELRSRIASATGARHG